MESTLGTELRQRREALGMSIDDLAREAKVAARDIRALEEGQCQVFPAKVYAQGALRRIGRVFARDGAEALMEAFNREWAAGSAGAAGPAGEAPRRRPSAGIRLTPRRLGAVAAAAFSLFLLGFWGMRLSAFTLSPALSVDSPRDHSRVSTPTMEVRGTTEKESRLTVNGREITIDERGAYRENIELPLGTNRLEFVSESRFGKTSREVRYVFVE
ncbi:MAG: helix-turn-helix domain-containing protein [Patescibacteria group bacterium]